MATSNQHELTAVRSIAEEEMLYTTTFDPVTTALKNIDSDLVNFADITALSGTLSNCRALGPREYISQTNLDFIYYATVRSLSETLATPLPSTYIGGDQREKEDLYKKHCLVFQRIYNSYHTIVMQLRFVKQRQPDLLELVTLQRIGKRMLALEDLLRTPFPAKSSYVDQDLVPWDQIYQELLLETPKRVFDSYPESETQSMEGTVSLVAIVYITTFACAILSFIAWYYSNNGKGTPNDDDFWTTLASSVMQLLGVSSLSWSILQRSVLSLEMKWWTWTLTCLSVVCTILAPALYCVIATKWSGVLGFVGIAGQSLMTLQLIQITSQGVRKGMQS